MTTLANRPSGSRVGVLHVEQLHNTTYILQTYINGIDDSGTAFMYKRLYNNSSWTDWEKIPTRAEVDALNSNSYWLGNKSSESADVDLDTYLTPGTYYFNNAGTVANHFPIVASGKLIVENRINSNNYKKQTFYSGDSTYGVFAREYNNGRFNDWVKQPLRSEIDALNSNSTKLELTDITASLNQVIISGKTGILTIYGTPATDIAAFTGNRIKLPSGFRPFVNENFYSATKIGENVVVSQWQVLTDGNVRCGTLLPANTNFQVTLSYAM